MTTLSTFIPFDMGLLNLNDAISHANSGGINIRNGVPVALGYRTYNTQLEVDWVDNGVNKQTLYLGDNLSFDQYGQLTGRMGGIIQYSVTPAVWTGANWTQEGKSTDWIIDSGLDYWAPDASAFWKAMNTQSNVDDLDVIQKVFAYSVTTSGSRYNDVFVAEPISYSKDQGKTVQEYFSGGPGVDTVVFDAPLSNYTLINNISYIDVGIKPSINAYGFNNYYSYFVTVDKDVEQIKFSDVTLVFDHVTALDKTVYALYQAAFNRMPDNSGFRFWAETAYLNNMKAIQIADGFMASPEFKQKYDGLNNNDFVKSMYSNVLGRTPDQAGLDFWVNQLNGGSPKDVILVGFATSPENSTKIAPHTSFGFWTI